ncbi:MAG: helix-turn-helix transcriptional regulator [Peptococcus niger]
MNKLKERREEQGYTQKDVATKVEISVRQYQKYEAGQVKPGVYIAKNLAKALNTTVEALF